MKRDMESGAAEPFAAEVPAPCIHHGTPAFRRTNLALFAAGLATFGLLYCVQPLMPQFSHDYAVSEAGAALSLSLTTGVLAVAMLFAGGVSDALGRKPVMVASLLASALLVLVSALMPDWTALLAVRTLLGLTLSGLPAVAMTYLGEEMDAESIGLGMGLYISGNAIGGMGGRLVTGVLTDFFDWRVGVVVVAGIGLASGLMFWKLLPPSHHFERQPLRLRTLLARFAGVFRDAGLPWMFVEGFLLLGAFVTVYNYIGYRLLAPPFGMRQSAVGALSTLYLLGIFSSVWAGRLADKLGRRNVLWMVMSVMLAGLLLTLFDNVLAIVAGMGLFTFGFFASHSVASSWVGRRARVPQALASSIYLFLYYLGSSVVGWFSGFLWSRGGWAGVVMLLAAILLGAMLVALRLRGLAPLSPREAQP